MVVDLLWHDSIHVHIYIDVDVLYVLNYIYMYMLYRLYIIYFADYKYLNSNRRSIPCRWPRHDAWFSAAAKGRESTESPEGPRVGVAWGP